MTTRLEVLDMVGKFLTEQLGQEKVTQRPDGILIIAGSAEAFALQVLTIDAPSGVEPKAFGEALVKHIEGSGADEGDGEIFYASQNGDQWLLVTDTGGRRFVRHLGNESSGGAVELTDLQSFLEREPHSPQNRALEELLSKSPLNPEGDQNR